MLLQLHIHSTLSSLHGGKNIFLNFYRSTFRINNQTHTQVTHNPKCSSLVVPEDNSETDNKLGLSENPGLTGLTKTESG